MTIVVAAHEVELAVIGFYCVTFFIPQYKNFLKIPFIACQVLSYK